MPDLLLELFSEEIPARMQTGAARDLERLVVGALTDRGFLFEGIKAFAGPRRLTLAVSGLPAKQRDVREELKGPKVDAPQAAIEGFLRKAGLNKDQLSIETTTKGEFYKAVVERRGRDTVEVLAQILPELLSKVPWPKSMRWPQGKSASKGGAVLGQMGINTSPPNALPTSVPVRWVRPLHSIIATLDGEVVPFNFAGIQSGNTTRGHRFLSSGVLTVKRYDDYVAALRKAHVILDAEERKAIIFEEVKSAAFVHGLEMIPDEALLNEVAGLAEWPVVLIGSIPSQFMDVPAEILQTSMRTHQKYFSLCDPKTGKLANRFALVANMIAKDGGKEIVAGNERVLRARLSDAKFFWDEDRKIKLTDRVDALKNIVFHAVLGTQYMRTQRIRELVVDIAEAVGADVQHAQKAATLSKADLTSGVVGEFPELQGVMGRYYALYDGENTAVANAIRDHYKPAGLNDGIPTERVSIALALADKIDTLTVLFYAKEQATGSKDPFGLRRAALGVIRIILENKVRLNLIWPILKPTAAISGVHQALSDITERKKALESIVPLLPKRDLKKFEARIEGIQKKAGRSVTERDWEYSKSIAQQVLEFIVDRMVVVLKDRGVRHDLISAIFSLDDEDDLVRLVARVEALQAFLKTDDGANLLAGYKRAANILKAEEKKDAKTFISEVNEGLLAALPEKNLFAALSKAKAGIAPALEKEDFAAAMRQMASLRVPVDAFFDGVKVNDDDPKLRENRLNLLATLRAALHQVADFSRIEG